MKRFIEAGPKLVFLLALGIAARLIQSGDPRKIGPIVEAMILPHFDFAQMARIAMGVNWRQAAPAQQEQLAEQFKVLLVRTYAAALASYRDQGIELKPLRVGHTERRVTVRSEIGEPWEPGVPPLSIDYEMEKYPTGWKIFDVTIGGVSLATAYRARFTEEVRNHGIEGLIELLKKTSLSSSRDIGGLACAITC